MSVRFLGGMAAPANQMDGQVPQDSAAGAEFLAAIGALGRVRIEGIKAPQKQEGLKRGQWQWQYFEIKGMSLGAPPVAYLVVMESPNDSFRVMLPDGRVAMQMYTDLNPTKRSGMDRGTCALGYTPDGRSFRLTHEFGSLDCCIGKEPKKVLNFSTGEPSLELDPPPNPWMLPFLVFTACLGACCLTCMVRHDIPAFKSGTHCGTAYWGGCREGKNNRTVWTVESDDPKVASEIILAIAHRIQRMEYTRDTA